MMPFEAFAIARDTQTTTAAASLPCIIRKCAPEFLDCLGDVDCLAVTACLTTCGNAKRSVEESLSCQTRCQSLFESQTIDRFNDCVVSREKCVSPGITPMSYPQPSEDSIAVRFEPGALAGKWYISAGLNPLFDQHPCAVHIFEETESGLKSRFSYRVLEPDGSVVTRAGVAALSPNRPGVLNVVTGKLHQREVWYVLDFSEVKGEEFVLYYYQGSNDAWVGFGGAVLFTRTSTVPPALVQRVSKALLRTGIDFDKFVINDNSCGPLAASLPPGSEGSRYFKSFILPWGKHGASLSPIFNPPEGVPTMTPSKNKGDIGTVFGLRSQAATGIDIKFPWERGSD